MTRWRPPRVHWRYRGFLTALWLAGHTPRRLGYWLGALGGELYFWLNPRHSGKAVENLAVVLADDVGAPRVRDTARRAFRNYGKYLFDFFRQPSIDPDDLTRDVQAEGFEHLDAARARGRGGVLVLGHFGNWDLAGLVATARGYPLIALADTFSPPEIGRLVRSTRERAGLGVLPIEQRDALRHIQGALHRNRFVCFVFDRPQRDGGVQVDFFGQPAWLPAGPARFALRADATVLTAFLLRRPGDLTYYGQIEPPVEIARTGDFNTDVQRLTQAIVRRIEAHLRQYPDQWYMFRRMWSTESARRGGPAATAVERE